MARVRIDYRATDGHDDYLEVQRPQLEGALAALLNTGVTIHAVHDAASGELIISGRELAARTAREPAEPEPAPAEPTAPHVTIEPTPARFVVEHETRLGWRPYATGRTLAEAHATVPPYLGWFQARHRDAHGHVVSETRHSSRAHRYRVIHLEEPDHAE